MLRLRRRVYLDNNATTRVDKAVLVRMSDVLSRCHGNPSSLYRLARDAAGILEESRQNVADAVGAEADEIVFTGCASEANNQVLQSMPDLATTARKHIVATPIEHPSVLATLDGLRSRGLEVVFCPVDRAGRVVMAELERLVDARTLLVCCIAANNEIGIIQDVAAVAALAHQHGALAMSDCVQALGKIPVDVKAMGVDYAAFSAHKIHGPKGVGALYVRTGAPLTPLVRGGHQESGRRAGTEGLHNIAGLAAACARVDHLLSTAGRVFALKRRLQDGIAAVLPTARFNTIDFHVLANTLSVTFPGHDNAEMIAFLDYHGVSVSAGSACNTHANEASHVLRAIGLTDEEARQTLRFSLSSETTPREIEYALKVLRDYLERRSLPVVMVSPKQLDESMLYNDRLFIVDIRSRSDRRLLAGLPNSHEASAIFLKKYLNVIPKDKDILVVCQGGTDGPIAAYYLRSKGYKRVGFVVGGIVGWKLFQPALYRKVGGRNSVWLPAAA